MDVPIDQKEKLLATANSEPGQFVSYIIENPATKESFSCGEEEFFLFQSMNGTATTKEILHAFHARFGLELTLEDFRSFETRLMAMGLVKTSAANAASTTPAEASQPMEKTSPAAQARAPGKLFSSYLRSTEFLSRHRGWTILLSVMLAMLIPFAYRPGGEIQVLPPLQQQIQSPVSGKIAEVHQEGGDGRLLPRGSVVAKMISSEIENSLLTLEQSRSQQIATLDKAKSELAKLQSGARSEEITSAQAKLDQAVEQMSIASQELESSKVSAAYSTMVLPRMQQLYKSGSLALLQYEEAKKSADIDKINVEKATKNLASLTKARDETKAQLDLLKSGARPEDIDSARHTVEAAQADLSRIDQQIQYAKQQQIESTLLMPFDGYLVDSHLDFKKGAYLKVGDIYATAQNNSQPLVEAQLPEYDVEGVKVGAEVQVKLYAYPNSTLTGKVLSIQPAALPSSAAVDTVARMFRVLIEVKKPPFILKAGMTGFAKMNAGYRPLGMLLARPIVRFVQIEMWSWLP